MSYVVFVRLKIPKFSMDLSYSVPTAKTLLAFSYWPGLASIHEYIRRKQTKYIFSVTSVYTTLAGHVVGCFVCIYSAHLFFLECI